uniref:HTTM-like domain-containing protein n=1 Tax=Chrysotila carterae TaxID=13221 RepID=A0A7S4BKK9_CHRCT
MRAVLQSIQRRLAVSNRAVQLFRVFLGLVVLLDAADRFPSLEFLYSDAGSLPRFASLPTPDENLLYRIICIHGWFGSLSWMRALCTLQMSVAGLLVAGVRPVTSGFILWLLHISISLRNPSLIYILDRYLHLLLLYLVFLPHAQLRKGDHEPGCTLEPHFACSVASVALGVQLVLIYLDAGLGKVLDPAGAWRIDAEVPALDTYLRHTPFAVWLRNLLSLDALRVFGAAVAWTEALAAPLMLACADVRTRRLFFALGCSLHIGICLCMRKACSRLLPSPPGSPLSTSRRPSPLTIRHTARRTMTRASRTAA